MECLEKALLMARCIRKGMKKVKLQILRIPKDHSEVCSREGRTNTKTRRLGHSLYMEKKGVG